MCLFYNNYLLCYVTIKQKNPLNVPSKYDYIIKYVTQNHILLYIITNKKYD
jgi:hypothetical protein